MSSKYIILLGLYLITTNMVRHLHSNATCFSMQKLQFSYLILLNEQTMLFARRTINGYIIKISACGDLWVGIFPFLFFFFSFFPPHLITYKFEAIFIRLNLDSICTFIIELNMNRFMPMNIWFFVVTTV